MAVPPLGAQVSCTCRVRVRRRTEVPRLLGTHTRGTNCSTPRCTVGLSSARRAGLMHVPCAPTTADGVPRLLGTHTCCTIVAGCNFGFLPLGGQVSCTCCVRAAWYGSPLYARICILGLRSSLTTGLGSHLPTSAPGLSRPPTHICNWTESIRCTAKESVPRPHLHRDRIHCLADICATTAALRDICLCVATHV